MYYKILKIIFSGLLLVCLSIIISLILGEVLLRTFWSGRATGADYNSITSPDKMIGYRFIPNSSKTVIGSMNDYEQTIRINSHGFRGREHSIENIANKKRIVLMGDSDPFGQGVVEQDMLDVVMEKILNEANDQTYEVINLSMPGMGTLSEEYIFNTYGLRYKPDTVIFLITAANDLRDNVTYLNNLRRLNSLKHSIKDNKIRSRPTPIKFKLPKISDTKLYTFIKWQLRPLFLKSPLLKKIISFFYTSSTEDLPEFVRGWYSNEYIKKGLPAMKASLERINALCKENNIELIIAVIPGKSQYDTNVENLTKAISPDFILEELRKDPQKPQRIIKYFSNNKSIHYIEILDDFKYLSQEQNIILKHPIDGHLNARGTMEIAKILVRGLNEIKN